MVGALGLTFALHLAALGAAGEAVPPALAPAPIAGALAPVTQRQGGERGVLALPGAREPSAADASPFHRTYRPQEWVALVADRLNMRDAGVTHLALWVASWPVRLDASGARVCLRVTLPIP
jgi:hypothetical protein